VTTNAGHPLDRNLYQSVKGLAAAERVVAPGGTVIAAAACVDGVPRGGAFSSLLESATTAEDLLSMPSAHDQWQVQVLGRVLQRARVLFHSMGLSDDEVRRAQLEPVDDISATLRQLRPERVCVLPRGPLTVATVVGG
jgi:nickel-dependent lactate racemase